MTSPLSARVTFGLEVRRLLAGPDNAGDRLMVRLLAEAFEALTGHTVDRAAVVEAVAPLGVKKHFLLLAADDNPMLERAAGRARAVQEADLSAARVRLADHLAREYGFRNEQVSRERRHEVLNSAVAFLFGAVREVIAGVRPDGLLEELVAETERLIADAERARAILPARLATYPHAAETLRDDVANANQANICSRFLIEYVAAQPPSGPAQWSTARFDEAMGYVAELLDWANLSDAIHAGLSTVDLLIRDDGQLRLVEYDRYETGRGAFFGRHVEAERRRSAERFARRFEAARAAERSSSALIQRLDPFMEQEAGVTVTDLAELLVAANLVARDRGDDVVVLGRREAIRGLAERLDRTCERVETAVEYLSMGPRDDFLAPPGGTARDTFPWLFARQWSYNRRPFLERGEELLWGRRHPVAAMQIFVGQLTSGRYQAMASGKGLRRELGRLAKEAGAAFEERVAAVASGAGAVAVVRGVKRLGGERLERSSAESLGDIDVLVGDPGRRILWAIECKDLSGALTSAEVAREMTEHFRQVGTTSVTKHAERVAWLTDRVPAALERLGLESDADGWEVRGIVVTEREVIAPFIDDVPCDVVAIADLEGYLSTGA